MAQAKKTQLKDPTTGEKLYPVTSSACVGMSDGSGSLDTRIKNITTEYNISLFHPKQGIDGGNKYTLETAIALVPEQYRNIGLKCSFINEDGDGECWEYKGEGWLTKNFIKVGATKLKELASDLSTFSFRKGYVAAWAGPRPGQVQQNDSYSLLPVEITTNLEAIKIEGATIYNILCYKERPTYNSYDYLAVIPSSDVSSGYIQRELLPNGCNFIAINFENSSNTYENFNVIFIDKDKRKTEIGDSEFYYGAGSVLNNFDLLSKMINKGETVTMELSDGNTTSGAIYIFHSYPFDDYTTVMPLKNGVKNYTFIAPIEGYLRVSARYTDANKNVRWKVYSRAGNIIVFDGDSLTFGAGSDNIDGPVKKESFTRKLQKMLGPDWRDINQGYPGDTVQQIAGRIGEYGLYFSENVTLKADGTETQVGTFSGETCIIKSFLDDNKCPIGQFANPNTKYAGNFNPCCIFSKDKKLLFEVYPKPTQRQTQSTDPMFIKPLGMGENDITINAGTIFYPYSVKFKTCDVKILWQGTNNNMEANELTEYHKRAIDYNSTKKYILIGRHAVNDTTTVDKLKEQEQLFQKEFGSSFFNLRKYMNEHGLADAGLIPTAEDTQDIADGKCPRQLMTDFTHFKEIGYQLIAQQLYNIGCALGYWI